MTFTPRIVLLGLLVIGVLFFGLKEYGQLKNKWVDSGKAEIQAKWDEDKRKAEKEITELRKKANQKTVLVETKYVDRVKVIREKGREITKVVYEYLPTIELDGSFRVLHDAAVENRIPDPAEFATAAVTTSKEVAITVTENYELCHIAYARVNAWENWAKEQCSLNPEGCPNAGQ